MSFRGSSIPIRKGGGNDGTMSKGVRIWAEPVKIPTYLPPPPDKNPMFLEKRVYQGSNGKVYPCPFTDRVSDECVERTWQAVHLENEFLYVMILPEIGGRIHVGRDKTNGYDFFYRQNVIKPALVGLLGPWVSGGVEINWPQHHRPTTFMPVEWKIEEHVDGSKTVWLSEHEPMNRTKGMAGIRLRPERSFIEVVGQLYNRTPFTQSFLWWANVGVHAHDRYQAFFPPDVTRVADHARRAMSDFPLCRGFYYGVDYRRGVDLRWYKNIPVPTSYMALGSECDFVGGYDHLRQAGLVHVANHHISPGKKLWTWGNHEFGRAWDRELTDNDGPYVELMGGVFTDNQPDFSWMHPFETRTFRQYWYPIQKIGPAKAVNLDAALNLEVRDGRVEVGVSVSAKFPRAIVRLEAKGKSLFQKCVDLVPGHPCLTKASLPRGMQEADLLLRVLTHDGVLINEYRPRRAVESHAFQPATEPKLPHEIETNEELYLTGLHLEQYRHATRYPEFYWREALRRDPSDARSNNALGLWHLRRGEFIEAEKHFVRAIATLTRRNPNPLDGEPFYNLGLTLRFQGKDAEAYSAFYKAVWNYAWQSASYYALAEIDCRRGNWAEAMEHLDLSLANNSRHTKAQNLKAHVLEKFGCADEAAVLRKEILRQDPLDVWARTVVAPERVGVDASIREAVFDVALDLGNAGLFEEAIAVLESADCEFPMVLYALGFFADKRGDTKSAQRFYRRAQKASPDYCFPSRLEEMQILQAAIRHNPRDARAHYYLGNLFYDRKRHTEAIHHWETAARLDGSFSIAWRNLGIGYHNIQKKPAKARAAYISAFAANPRDGRLLYELDQLLKRLNESPQRRLVRLEKHFDLVQQRDDLSVEFAALCNQTGQSGRALGYLQAHRFHPWEGGEGLALGQYVRARLLLGRAALEKNEARQAMEPFQAALQPPKNLGEIRHPLANQSDVWFWLGEACAALRDTASARKWWKTAANFRGDFQEMSVKPFSEMTFFQARSLERLNCKTEARELFRDLLASARKLLKTDAKIDYFATSLPAMLLFEVDLQQKQTVTATFLLAQANAGLGRKAEAKKLLRRVLSIDASHAMAADLLTQINPVAAKTS